MLSKKYNLSFIKRGHKQMKLRKNVKLIHGTIALIVVAFIALAFVSLISFTSSSKLNNYYTSLSTDSVVTIETYGDIISSFNEERVYVTKVIDRPYTDEQANDVNTADTNIKAGLSKIKLTDLSTSETAALNKIETDYESYMSSYSDVESKRKSGLAITPVQSKQFAAIGALITSGLKNSINNEKVIITNDTKDYKNVFIGSNTLFLIVVLISALILLAISWIFIHELKSLLKEMINIIKVIASGDFTSKIDTSSNTEFGNMNRQLNIMQTSTSDLLRKISTVAATVGDESQTLSAVSEEMSASSLEVAEAINEVAVGSTTQAGELMSVNQSIKSFGNELKTFVTLTNGVNSRAGSIGSIANTSNEQLTGLVESLNNISKSFDGVINRIKLLEGSITEANEITGLINSISEQTNLLALNAAIEAARAGESGRGFSVVADEIRKLAEQSKQSSDTISGLLGNVASETSNLVVTTGDVSKELTNEVTTINSALNTFKSIITSVETMLPDIQNVSAGISKLNNDMTPVILTIENTSAVSEENSASSEEIAASTEEIKNSAGSVATTAQTLTGSVVQLTEELGKFKL